MKIAMVADRLDSLDAAAGAPQGMHVHVGELAAALARAGQDVVVYTRRSGSGRAKRIDTAHGYRVVQIPADDASPSETDAARAMGEFAGYLQKQWKRNAPDITHAHYWLSGLATQLATRPLGLPTVQTFHSLGALESRNHSGGETDPSVIRRIRVERILARGATRAVATSSEEVSEIARMGLPRTRTSIVPCGVDTTHYRSAGNGLPEPSHTHRLVTVGPLSPASGFDIAIRALAYLSGVELAVVAHPTPTGPSDDEREYTRLRAIARRAGVEDRVRFHRNISRDEMPGLFRGADASVHLPSHDSTGMVALQAMACGRPVIASAVGSMLDTVLDDVTGLLVPTRSPEAVADAVRKVVGDPTRAATYGIAARDRIAARYSWDRIAEDTIRVYEQCVPRQSVPDRGTQIGAL